MAIVDGNDTATALYPSSDPLVTAVGGTEGLPYPGGLLRGGYGFWGNNGGGYGAEQVWNEADAYDSATGGAPSMLFPRPSYQNGVVPIAAAVCSIGLQPWLEKMSCAAWTLMSRVAARPERLTFLATTPAAYVARALT